MTSQRAIRVVIVLAALGLSPVVGAAPGDDVEGAYAAAALDRDLLRMFPGRAESPGFAYQFRPGGAGETARVDLEAKLDAALEKVTKRLELKPRRIRVYVYETGAEMVRLTGRPSSQAAAIGEAIHIPLDRPVVGPALARALESQWAAAGDKLGGGLEGGHWYKLHLLARGPKLAVTVDGRKLADVPAGALVAGGIGFGVEEGRIGVRDLKVRAAPPEGQSPGEWTIPLRGDKLDKTWPQEVPGRWRLANEEIEGTNYGRLTRLRYVGGDLKDVELECEIRLSEGAVGEVHLQATSAGPGGTRLVFRPGSAAVVGPGGFRLVTGPHPLLREGLACALASEVDAMPVEALARALLDANLAPSLDKLRMGFPRNGTERFRAEVTAGAFVLHALATMGQAKYRELHFSDLTTAKTPAGDLGELEAAWRKALKAKAFDTTALKDAARRLGVDTLGDGSRFKDHGQALRAGGFKVEGTGSFTSGERGLRWFSGGAQGMIGRAFFPDQAPPKVAVRAAVMLHENSRCRLLLKARDGRTTAVLLAPSGAQLLTPDNTVAAKSDQNLDPGRFYDCVLVLEGGAGRVYLDGELVAETSSGLTGGPGRLMIECEGRKVDVRSALVRNLE